MLNSAINYRVKLFTEVKLYFVQSVVLIVHWIWYFSTKWIETEYKELISRGSFECSLLPSIAKVFWRKIGGEDQKTFPLWNFRGRMLGPKCPNVRKFYKVSLGLNCNIYLCVSGLVGALRALNNKTSILHFFLLISLLNPIFPISFLLNLCLHKRIKSMFNGLWFDYW